MTGGRAVLGRVRCVDAGIHFCWFSSHFRVDLPRNLRGSSFVVYANGHPKVHVTRPTAVCASVHTTSPHTQKENKQGYDTNHRHSKT